MSSPFLWSMTQTFKKLPPPDPADTPAPDLSRRVTLFVSRLLTVFLVGILSLEFFSLWLAVLLTILVATLLFIVFKNQLETFYQWFESQFKLGFHAQIDEKKSAEILSRLAPWDAHLVPIRLHPNSPFVAKSLFDLQLREKYGLNVVVIQRGARAFVAPKANEVLLPDDQLLFLGTDEQLDTVRPLIEKPPDNESASPALSQYQLWQIRIKEGSALIGHTILQTGIRERFSGMVVGIERGQERIFNPKSDFVITEGDRLWVVVYESMIEELASYVNKPAS